MSGCRPEWDGSVIRQQQERDVDDVEDTSELSLQDYGGLSGRPIPSFGKSARQAHHRTAALYE